MNGQHFSVDTLRYKFVCFARSHFGLTTNATSFLIFQHDGGTFFESFEETPLIVAFCTYLCYGMLVVVGHIHDFLRYYGLEVMEYTEVQMPASIEMSFVFLHLYIFVLILVCFKS